MTDLRHQSPFSEIMQAALAIDNSTIGLRNLLRVIAKHRSNIEGTRAAIPSATDTDAIRAAEDRGIAIGLRAAAAWASDEANKCDDAAKWGGHRTYVANCKAAAYALRNAVLKIGGIKTDEARKIGGGE